MTVNDAAPLIILILAAVFVLGGALLATRVAGLPPIIRRALVAAVIFICHALLACIVVLTVVGVEALIRWAEAVFNAGEKLQLFGRVPLSWLFQAIDVAMVSLFGVSGFIEAAKELFRRE